MASKDWVSAEKQDKNSDQIEEKLVPELRFSEFDDEWKEFTLGNISSKEMYGINAPSKEFDGLNKYIRITDISDNSNKYIPNPLTSPDSILENKFKLKKGDIVFARTGASTGKSYIYDEADGNLYFAGFLIRFHIDKANPQFIFYNTLTEKYLNWVSIMSVRSGQPGINAKEYKKLKINLPSIEEQNKIVGFISKIDLKIDLMERKQDILVKYKWGLLQKIFSEKSNLYTSKIGEIFEERSEKGFSDLELLSVTLKNGVIKRSDIESKDNSNINKDNYKHVLPGDIVYNSMRMWQGASGVSEFEGIVSPAYTILKSNNKENSHYFAYYFKTHRMINQFKKYSQGLTSDTWNLKYPLISEISIKIHPLKEQNKIANFLSEIDNKIDLVEQQLEKIKEFKKYLLQKMFI